MYFTVRGRDQNSLKSEVVVDLTKWNIPNPLEKLTAQDVIKNISVNFEPGSDPGCGNFHVDLEAGEVGVFCLSEKKPSGFQIH